MTRCSRRQGFVRLANNAGNLLIPRGDIAGPGDIDEERGKNKFQAILVPAVDRIRPLVLNCLKFLDLGAGCRGCPWSGALGRGSGVLSERSEAGEQNCRNAGKSTNHREETPSPTMINVGPRPARPGKQVPLWGRFDHRRDVDGRRGGSGRREKRYRTGPETGKKWPRAVALASGACAPKHTESTGDIRS